MFQDMVKTGDPMLWWMPFLEGVFAVFVGLMFLSAPQAALELVLVLLGLYWLMSGLLAIAGIFSAGHRRNWGVSLLVGLAGITAGLIVLGHPTLSRVILPAALVLGLGALGIVVGILQIVRAVRGQGATAFIVGVLSLLLGVVLIARPLLSGIALPLIFGALNVLAGLALFGVAYSLWRKTRQALSA